MELRTKEQIVYPAINVAFPKTFYLHVILESLIYPTFVIFQITFLPAFTCVYMRILASPQVPHDIAIPFTSHPLNQLFI